MLHIVGSYHGMQFEGKLMNNLENNAKNRSFMLNFGPFGTNSSFEKLSDRWMDRQRDKVISPTNRVIS